MAFITDEDYTVLIRDEIKGILYENYTTTKLRNAEQMAIAQTKNYLAGRYDVETIFSETGTGRNAHIVMIVLDCALYHLYTSTVPKSMPETRANRYQDAIDWLKLVATGDALADLPPKKNAQGKVLEEIRFSSKYKSTNHRW